MEISHHGGVEFRGACVDNTVYWHTSEETAGVAFIGMQSRCHAWSPCYFNTADYLFVFYGGTVGTGAPRPSGEAHAVLAYGQFFNNS